MKDYVNLGCGHRFHSAWTNVDFVNRDPSVIKTNLLDRIPFPNEHFRVVYHSHLLEHFSKAQAVPFLRECFRVLKSGGIIRIAVPDLERIAALYLEALNKASIGDPEWKYNYQWVMLELYDQSTRNSSGGNMISYLSQDELPNKAFVINRGGLEAQQIIEYAKNRHNEQPASTRQDDLPLLIRKLRSVYRLLRYPRIRREWFLQRLLGGEYSQLQLGRFRQGGEIHLWMYDRYSLAQLLQEVGFDKPHRVGPTESRIPQWSTYCLDTEPNGAVYKPESLFMEATKP